jgi:hypothetical protein
MDIHDHVKDINPATCKEVLTELLSGYLNPAFGALPSKEVELLILRALSQLRYVQQQPSLYELVSKLRVTRPKARNLIYAQELRSLDPIELDERVRVELKRPLIQKQGELFVLEIENPLVIDHLRAKLKEIGYATDGSFSPSLVKITLDGLVALIEEYLDDAQQETVRQALVEAGAPDKSLRGALKAALRELGKKVAQDAGEAVADQVADYLGPILDAVGGKIVKLAAGLFSKT